MDKVQEYVVVRENGCLIKKVSNWVEITYGAKRTGLTK